MTITEQIITTAMCVLGTMLTRFLPFAVFRSSRPTPRYIQYLGKVLPGAVFAMLVFTICGMYRCCKAATVCRSCSPSP